MTAHRQLELVPWGPFSFGWPLYAVRLPVEPKPAPRPIAARRKRGAGEYVAVKNPDDYDKWLGSTADIVRQWWLGKGREPISHPVAVDVECVLSSPVRKGSVQVAGCEVPFVWDDEMWCLGPEDTDNLAKSILDAMVDAGVFLDDRLIVELTVRKIWSDKEKPRIDVRIYNAGRYSDRHSFLERAKALLQGLMGAP